MTDRELSDFSIERKECPKCGALWINGQHYWSGTGKVGNEDDLAGLVCNNLGDDTCINPKRGSEIGTTWEKRLTELENDHPST
jgi:hypothetical protein